jgi:hypothetical protein
MKGETIRERMEAKIQAIGFSRAAARDISDAILNTLSEPGEEVMDAVKAALCLNLNLSMDLLSDLESDGHLDEAARAAIKAFISEIGGAG